MENPWIVRFAPRPPTHQRLFCFPYAGGGTALFASWRRGLPDFVGVSAIRPPGREIRLHEKPITDLRRMAEGVADALEPELERPFAFFGHSMGGLLAFEVVRELRRREWPQPTRLFISASRAPSTPRGGRPFHRLANPDLLQQLRWLNGTPLRVLEDAGLMDIFLPTIRADFKAVETHAFEREPALSIPISCFAGADDTLVPRSTVEPWRLETDAAFTLKVVAGSHFFVHAARNTLLDAISRDLLADLGPGSEDAALEPSA